jgi:hypothetical protein
MQEAMEDEYLAVVDFQFLSTDGRSWPKTPPKGKQTPQTSP